MVEAHLALQVLDWLPAHLSRLVGVIADTDRLGLAGHSRGGGVAWLMLSNNPSRVQAVAGIDPVDPGIGSFSLESDSTDLAFEFTFLIIGAGLANDPLSLGGISCAPEGANHIQFYAASPSPAWHIFAPEAGHMDILNDDFPLNIISLFCGTGTNSGGMRKLTAGMLTAFFRGSLQDDIEAFDVLTDIRAAPISIDVESK